MTLSLARDSLNYSQTQLEALAQQVRLGDLTPVMQIYEEDIRTPIRSAVSGTLLRNAFIQVQKAKVCFVLLLSLNPCTYQSLHCARWTSIKH